ncbi:MAG: hypothetical protein AAF909_10000 [Pseudomonadota bacterium]
MSVESSKNSGEDGRARRTLPPPAQAPAQTAAPGKLAKRASTRGATASGEKSGPQVDALAAAALSVLAARSPKAPDAKFAARIEKFCDALVSPDEAPARLFAARLIAYGVSTEQIYERYVPAAARRLGEWWVEDKVGFVEVTLGSSRLQDLTRELEGRFVEGGSTIPLGHSVLLAVPRCEQHSLGAFIAGGKLRRMGLWVHMGVALDDDELARLAESQRFSAIGLSAATRRALEPLRRTIDKLRGVADFDGAIGLGGAITKLGDEVASYTGADLATAEPALFGQLCQKNAQTRLIDYAPLSLVESATLDPQFSDEPF